MSRFLKQSTAATAVIGPALDLSASTYLSAQSATVNLSKGNAVFALRNSTASASAHDTLGWYRFPLDTTDTGTVGPLVIIMTAATQLPVWHEFTVLPANAYDSLISGTDSLSASVIAGGIRIGAFAASALSAAAISNNSITSGILAASAIGASQIAASAVTNAVFKAAAIDNASIAASAIGTSQLAQNCIGSIQLSAGAIAIGKFAASALSAAAFSNSTIASGIVALSAISTGTIADGAITSTVLAAGSITATVIATDAIDADALASDAVTEIWAKACTEPTSVPAVTATGIQTLSWLLALSRNKITQTSAAQTLRNDADAATIASATVSDDGTTFTRAEFA